MTRIPGIDSIERLARFWDSHDLTEFESELEEVTEPVFDQTARTVVRFCLEPKEAEALKRVARSKGLDEGDLLREWVLEKLRAP